MVGTESDNACSIAAFFSFTYLAKSISAFVSATAIASIRGNTRRFPALEEEEEENPTSDDETFLFEEEEEEEEDIEIREDELKNIIDEDEVDATVKTLIVRAYVSNFY